MKNLLGQTLHNCFCVSTTAHGTKTSKSSMPDDIIIAQYDDGMVKVSTGDIYHYREDGGKLYAV